MTFEIEKKKRLLLITCLVVAIAAATSLVARVLVSLIDFFTNIFFFGSISFAHSAPASNTLGVFVVLIPVIGGLIVGLMAYYGSKAIRGHGIPEAMEQILTNQSKIRPAITILKPLSAAISIGAGGPFGAEGPIISTGGALGSTIGQLLRITPYERKILLASGATAGMSAIFGSPLAAIFLAIELLLFEFSPRSIIPIALACITGAAGHHFLFEAGPVFPVGPIDAPSNLALAFYSLTGILIGAMSVVITKAVYFTEDTFEKLPIHWMWWPALGGIAVGGIGYFAPKTLGVGYDNIIDLLTGNVPMLIVFNLCLWKFLSWSIALGSGTSGGTLAPLLTIGAAAGTLTGSLILGIFPEAGITLPLAALVGMSAMFAGASRALLTSIIFGLETTEANNALLPLLAACVASYFVSFVLMKNTIMTEKIARRGIATPHSYESDALEQMTVREAMQSYDPDQFTDVKEDELFIAMNLNLRVAAERMADEGIYEMKVIDPDSGQAVGSVSYKEIIAALRRQTDHPDNRRSAISLRRKALKIASRTKQIFK